MKIKIFVTYLPFLEGCLDICLGKVFAFFTQLKKPKHETFMLPSSVPSEPTIYLVTSSKRNLLLHRQVL